MEVKIQPVQMFSTVPMVPMWLGTFPSLGSDNVEELDKSRMYFVGSTTLQFSFFVLKSGWKIEDGNYWEDNTGSGFVVNRATNIDFPEAVICGGDYNNGFLSNSREALEHFVKHHPPYESD